VLILSGCSTTPVAPLIIEKKPPIALLQTYEVAQLEGILVKDAIAQSIKNRYLLQQCNADKIGLMEFYKDLKAN
jgi:hypothetical protein